jgi:hypothetical protein
MTKRTRRSDLRGAWIEFVNRLGPYEWFLHLTFRYYIEPEQAKRKLRRFMRKVNESIFGRRYREKGLRIRCVYAMGFQDRDVIHFHCLFGGGVYKAKSGLYRHQWQAIWHKENGHARISPFDPEKGAIGYLAKHIGEGGEIDII